MTILNDRYELTVPLGRNAAGIVWRAKRLDDDERIALAVVDGESLTDENLFQAVTKRFNHDFRALKKAKSPHLPTVHEVGEDPAGRAFAAMELVEGDSLNEWLTRKRSPAEVAKPFDEILRGLEAAHRVRVTHGDLEPGNVLMRENDEAVVVGFGLNRALATVDTAGWVAGSGLTRSLGYRAPEQAGASSGPPVDLYSVGVMLHQALTGRMPEVGRSVADFEPALPGSLVEVVDRALNDRPAKRYANAWAMRMAFAAAVRNAARGEKPPAPSVRPSPPSEEIPVVGVSAADEDGSVDSRSTPKWKTLPGVASPASVPPRISPPTTLPAGGIAPPKAVDSVAPPVAGIRSDRPSELQGRSEAQKPSDKEAPSTRGVGKAGMPGEDTLNLEDKDIELPSHPPPAPEGLATSVPPPVPEGARPIASAPPPPPAPRPVSSATGMSAADDLDDSNLRMRDASSLWRSPVALVAVVAAAVLGLIAGLLIGRLTAPVPEPVAVAAAPEDATAVGESESLDGRKEILAEGEPAAAPATEDARPSQPIQLTVRDVPQGAELEVDGSRQGRDTAIELPTDGSPRILRVHRGDAEWTARFVSSDGSLLLDVPTLPEAPEPVEEPAVVAAAPRPPPASRPRATTMRRAPAVSRPAAMETVAPGSMRPALARDPGF